MVVIENHWSIYGFLTWASSLLDALKSKLRFYNNRAIFRALIGRESWSMRV